MQNVKTKVLYGLLAVGGIAVHLATVGGTAALANALGFWAYPTHFGIGCFQFGAILAVPWFRKYLVFNEERFSKGIWPWVRKRGAFAFVLAAGVLVSPFLAAVVIRFLALPERKAWTYGFIVTFIGTLLWISIYLGAVSWVRSLLSTLFAA